MDTDTAPRSRTALTFARLREAILHARFPPGQKLRIDSLGREFDASTGAVREALSRLTAEGLVVAEPQKGFVVAPISRRDLVDLTEVRVEVECRCLADSIGAGDLDWEGSILSLQHKLRALDSACHEVGTPRGRQWHEAHEAFHDTLTALCPNTWWLRLRRQLYVQSERYRRLSGPLEFGRRNLVAEHDAIADAAIRRDTGAAVAAMAQHLRRTTELILTAPVPYFDDSEAG
jgi:DNA-binding GntR family transcriptional regulator